MDGRKEARAWSLATGSDHRHREAQHSHSDRISCATGGRPAWKGAAPPSDRRVSVRAKILFVLALGSLARHSSARGPRDQACWAKASPRALDAARGRRRLSPHVQLRVLGGPKRCLLSPEEDRQVCAA